MIAKHHVKAQIYKINTNKSYSNYVSQTKMKGNVITYPQEPEMTLTILPIMPRYELFQRRAIIEKSLNVS